MPEKEDNLKKRYASLDDKVNLEPQGEDAVRPDCLITFPFEYAGGDTEVAIDTEEFTALCPWTGLPDYGRLTVRYVPDEKCLELKSVKYYLLGFRNVGILQEDAANRILKDLVEACRPRKMTVTLDYNVRGGLHTVVTAKHG